MKCSNINTDALCSEIGLMVQTRLSELLADYEDRFNLYESVYNHIANLNLSRNYTRNETIIHEQRNDTNDFCKLVLSQLGELKTEVQSLKNISHSFVEVKKMPQENISLVIADSCSDLSSDSEAEQEQVVDEDDEQVVDEQEQVVDEQEQVVDEQEEEDELVEKEDEEEDEDKVVDEQQVYEQQVYEQQVVDEEQVVYEQQQVVDEQQVAVTDILSVDIKEEEDDDEEYTEIEIDGISYCTNDESNGFIYEVDDDGGVGKKVGYIKNEEPFFY